MILGHLVFDAAKLVHICQESPMHKDTVNDIHAGQCIDVSYSVNAITLGTCDMCNSMAVRVKSIGSSRLGTITALPLQHINIELSSQTDRNHEFVCIP